MVRQAHIVSFEDARLHSLRGDAPVARRRDSKSAARDASEEQDARGNASSDRGSGWHESRSRYHSSLALAGGRRDQAKTTEERTRTRGEVAPSRKEERVSRAEESRDARDRRRRTRTKAKADRMFNRQFAAEQSNAARAEEGAPRAALYKGNMGTNQRKAARMQKASSAGPVTAKLDLSGWQIPAFVTERRMKIATAVLCLIMVGVFLYTPAQQFYQAQREHDRLAAEYSVIDQRNDVLNVQNDILASDAGLEDAVREKYGYIRAGEQSAVVSGLSENTTDTSRDSENVEANVLSSSVKSPDEWYTPLLDAFFNVE